jgi:hypothetical protein
VRAIAAFVQTRGLVRAPALVESAAGLVVAALVVLAWYGLGAVLLRVIEGPSAPATPRGVAAACALGAGTWSLVWFFLGVARAYRPTPAVIALAGGLALAAVARWQARRAPHPADLDTDDESLARRGSRIPLALSGVAVAAAGIAALAPPTAKDTLMYHLALPRAFVTVGWLAVVRENMASYFPLGGEMNGLWAMLLGRVVSPRVGEAAFGVTSFAFLPLLLLFVYGWVAERSGGRAWAATAAALVATVPAVYEAAASGYVDLALSLYVALAAHAAARWWQTGARRALATLALALGFALGVKLLAFFPLVLLGLVALLGARRAGQGAGLAVVAVAGAVLVGSPWYIRTWRLTGSPFFPFYLDIWPGAAPYWDTTRSVMYRAFNWSYGGDKDLLGYLALPFRLSLMAQHEIPTLYENVLGVAFLAAVPLVAWALWRRRVDGETAALTVIAGALFVWWAASAQVLRYLIPALPLAAVVAVRAAAALEREIGGTRWLRATLLVPAGAALIVLLTWFLGDASMLSVLGAEPRAEYLTRRLDYYPYYRIVNEQLPEDARVWLIDVRRDTYHLDRAYRADYFFEDYTVRKEIEAGRDADALRAMARAEGITHVLIRHDFLFDYARSPLVDDRLPQAENVARLTRLRDFLLQGTRILRGDRKFLLVALGPENP